MRLACLLAPTSRRSFSCLVAFSPSFAEAKSHRFTFVYTQTKSHTKNRPASCREAMHFQSGVSYSMPHDTPPLFCCRFPCAVRGRGRTQNVSKLVLPCLKFAPISISLDIALTSYHTVHITSGKPWRYTPISSELETKTVFGTNTSGQNIWAHKNQPAKKH